MGRNSGGYDFRNDKQNNLKQCVEYLLLGSQEQFPRLLLTKASGSCRGDLISPHIPVGQELHYVMSG